MKNKKILFFVLLILFCILFIINDNFSFIHFFKLLFLFIIFIAAFLLFNTCNLKYITYKIKDQHIEVLSDKNDSKNAAQIIYTIDQNIQKLISYLNKKYSDENLDKQLYNNILIKSRKHIFIRNTLKELNNSYKSNTNIENFPEKKNVLTSYNVNKGNNIYLCLRKYNNYNFHDDNEIMFVALHELSHNCTHTPGHNKDFWYIFRFLLENAIEINIYHPINYKINKFNYCSTDVTYNPLYDDTLKDEIYLLKNSK